MLSPATFLVTATSTVLIGCTFSPLFSNVISIAYASAKCSSSVTVNARSFAVCSSNAVNDTVVPSGNVPFSAFAYNATPLELAVNSISSAFSSTVATLSTTVSCVSAYLLAS